MRHKREQPACCKYGYLLNRILLNIQNITIKISLHILHLLGLWGLQPAACLALDAQQLRQQAQQLTATALWEERLAVGLLLFCLPETGRQLMLLFLYQSQQEAGCCVCERASSVCLAFLACFSTSAAPHTPSL